jgi:hypothetical protein
VAWTLPLTSLMISTTVRWARIEYQLDLRSAQTRIPLGVIVLTGIDGTLRAVVAGRAPRAGAAPPDALKSVGPLGRSQLDGWVAAMAKDVLAAVEKREDPLETLVSTWCWNLSVVVAEDVVAQPGETIRDVAGRLYGGHLGSPLPHGLSTPLTQPAHVAADDAWSFTEATYAAA